MVGLPLVGFTEAISEAEPTHTFPVFVLITAAVFPPITVSISAVMLVFPCTLTVEAAILLAFVPSAITVSPSCWAISKRAAVEAIPASASRFFTLNRAALWSLSEVTHTVPSSSCTCGCVTELTMTQPATMPSNRTSMTTGVIHRRLPDGTSRRVMAGKRFRISLGGGNG